jgi:putative transposase
MRKPYPSVMTGDQWALLEPLIPVSTLGRPRDVEIREVLNAIFYQARSGCLWDMLPQDFPPKSTVFDYFKQWRDDGGKKLRARKRHIVVDSLGLLLVVLVTAASADDGTTAPEVLAKLTAEHRSRLGKVWADGKYHNHGLNAWMKREKVGYEVEVVSRPAGSKGFVLLHRRWVVER